MLVGGCEEGSMMEGLGGWQIVPLFTVGDQLPSTVRIPLPLEEWDDLYWSPGEFFRYRLDDSENRK